MNVDRLLATACDNVATAAPSAASGRSLLVADNKIAEDRRRVRTSIVIAWQGVAYTVVTGAVYAGLGSPWSGAAIASIAVPLLFVPRALRRGLPLVVVGNAITAMTWAITFVVAVRTGGFASPAVVWSFFHPITTYVACGRRSASVWSVLSVAQIAVFYGAASARMPLAYDLSPAASDMLRMAGFIGCIVALSVVMASIEGVRAASQDALDRANRALDRQRILGDMHDGVGSQLLGLIVQVRNGKMEDDRLLQGLTACLDDLKLIVDSLDPAERSFELALAELRARLEPRCTAAGVTLAWADADPTIAAAIDAEAGLQVLRALQEMISNAVRHARSDRIDVSVARVATGGTEIEVVVRDHGIGFDPEAPPRIGRGLVSLRTRAQRLDGALTVEPASPGTRVALRFAS